MPHDVGSATGAAPTSRRRPELPARSRGSLKIIRRSWTISRHRGPCLRASRRRGGARLGRPDRAERRRRHRRRAMVPRALARGVTIVHRSVRHGTEDRMAHRLRRDRSMATRVTRIEAQLPASANEKQHRELGAFVHLLRTTDRAGAREPGAVARRDLARLECQSHESGVAGELASSSEHGRESGVLDRSASRLHLLRRR